MFKFGVDLLMNLRVCFFLIDFGCVKYDKYVIIFNLFMYGFMKNFGDKIFGILKFFFVLFMVLFVLES